MIISEHLNLISHLSSLNRHLIDLTFHLKILFVKSNSFLFSLDKSFFLEIEHVSVFFKLPFPLIEMS